LNLLVNAAQAVPPGDEGRGRVRIATGTTEAGAFVEVTDNGAGIPEDVISRIFEPFFTTKPAGEGTGLGLSISHDIVASHGGRLSVRSTLGQGTTFRVELPKRPPSSLPAPAPETRAKTAPPPDPLPAALRSRVLVVDDEPMICILVARVLAAHDVVTKASAMDALAQIREGDTDFDVVFCDLSMPGMDGSALYEEVSRSHPHLASRFVFLTGAEASDESRRFVTLTGLPIVEKPFPFSMLTRFVETPLRSQLPRGD
jgi:CheY-like chemotaxis protein